MEFLKKFEQFNLKISLWIEWVGLLAFFFMMIITCVDVAGTKLFKMPVFGALDMAEVSQLIAITFACGIALITNRHVQVEFLVALFPKRLKFLADCIINLLGFLLFIIIVWRLFIYGYNFMIEGEETPTAKLPSAYFVYGAAIASIPVALIFLNRFIASIIKVVKE